MLIKAIVFIGVNFAALGLGSLLMGAGPGGEWYQSLNKAPWTPPGWVFGAAWFLIMVCFSFYIARLWDSDVSRSTLLTLFIIQLVLNIGWNPVFFNLQLVLPGLLIIASLAVLVGVFLFKYWSTLQGWSLLILPYFIWLLIATSLNAYILVKN